MASKQQPDPERPADPPYWIADTDLFLGEPGAGALPVRAHAAGDQVPHEHVVRYGWQDAAHVPEQWAAPGPPPEIPRAPAPPAPAPKAAVSGSEE